jgi:MFS family permease
MKPSDASAASADRTSDHGPALTPPPAATASPWPVFGVASIATFLVALDSTMLFAAFDPLRHAFASASAADLSWVINAYTVVYATMLIPAGGLADTYGRKRVFLLGGCCFWWLRPLVAWRAMWAGWWRPVCFRPWAQPC